MSLLFFDWVPIVSCSILSDSVAAKSGFPLSTHVLHLFNKL